MDTTMPKEERDRRKRIERKQYIEDFTVILETHEGFRLFKDFFKKAGIFNKTFTGNSRGYYLDGRREFALEFVEDAQEASYDTFMKIWKEIKEEAKNEC